MIKNFILHSILAGLLFFQMTTNVLCEDATDRENISSPVISQSTHDSTSPSPAISTPAEIVFNRLEEAKRLVNVGEFQKAENLYEKILHSEDLTRNQIRKINKAYGEVKLNQLYSKEISPGTFNYKVASGDSLYKIAKKYNTTIELIKKVNGLKKDTIYPDQNLKLIKGTFSIHVDKSDNELILKLEGKPWMYYDVATGENNSTPTGEFKIKTKLENPTWYKTGAVIPPGSPENGLGNRWLGFDKKGYGIHGTTHPDTIGQQVSAGCIRMHNRDAEVLYDFVPRDTLVTVVD